VVIYLLNIRVIFVGEIIENIEILVDEYVAAVLRSDPRIDEVERQLLSRWAGDPQELLVVNRMANLISVIASSCDEIVSEDQLQRIKRRILS
jgi:hypothetical protein